MPEVQQTPQIDNRLDPHRSTMPMMPQNPASDNCSTKNITATEPKSASKRTLDNISRSGESGIVRVYKKRNNFVIIDKTGLEDERLSFKARGILAFLLGKPDDWYTSMKHLERSSEKDGRESVRSGVKELMDIGYMIRVPNRTPDGHFKGHVTIVFETPADRDEYLSQSENQEQNEDISTAKERRKQGSTNIEPKDGFPVSRESRQSENPTDGKPANLVNNQNPLIKKSQKTTKRNTQDAQARVCVTPSGCDAVSENAEEPNNVDAIAPDSAKEEELTAKEVNNIGARASTGKLNSIGALLLQDAAELAREEQIPHESIQAKIKPSESISVKAVDPVIQVDSLNQDQAKISLPGKSSSVGQSSAAATAPHTLKRRKRQDIEQNNSTGDRAQKSKTEKWQCPDPALYDEFVQFKADSLAKHKSGKGMSAAELKVYAKNCFNSDPDAANELYHDAFLPQKLASDRLAAIDDPRDQLIEEMRQKATGELNRLLLEYNIPHDVLLAAAQAFDGGKGQSFSEWIVSEWRKEQEAIANQQPRQPVNFEQDAPQNSDADPSPETLEKQLLTTAVERETQRLYQRSRLRQDPAIVDPSLLASLTWKCPDESLASQFIVFKAQQLPDAELGNIEAAIARINSDPSKAAGEWKMFSQTRKADAAMAQMSYEEIFQMVLEPKLNRKLRQIVQERKFNLDQLRIIDQTFEAAENTTEPNSFCMEHIPFLKEIVTQLW